MKLYADSFVIRTLLDGMVRLELNTNLDGQMEEGAVIYMSMGLFEALHASLGQAIEEEKKKEEK